MVRMQASIPIVLLATLFAACSASADIIVAFEPSHQVVNLPDGTATVNIVALIPQSDAIVGWGIDLDILGTSVVRDSVAIGPAFTAVTAPDLDGLAAIAPVPPGAPVWAAPIPVVLATVTFTLAEVGLSDLVLSDDYPFDLNEGFALNPPPVGAYANVTYMPGSIEVLPEPAALALLALGGLLVRRR